MLKMSMLADRRYRKQYTLVPRGKPLYEDGNSFGTRMMEKMGWSKGKGLGANEDGNQDFIRVKYKNDANGLGFEDRDDGWTQHRTDFETLLKSLNNSLENSDEEQDLPATMGFGFQNEEKGEVAVPKLSGESLEEKSKKSRARVHYKKFTRGKDLSQYSEKDLANIFGKKNLSVEQNEPEKVEIEDEKFDNSSVFGIQTIITGTSINDYFKNKIAFRKNGTAQNNEKNENGEDEDSRYKISSTKKRSNNSEKDDSGEGINEVVPNTKRKKNNQVGNCNEQENGNIIEDTKAKDASKEEENNEQVVPKKSKKKSKHLDETLKFEDPLEHSNLLGSVKEIQVEVVEGKSKKKKKYAREQFLNQSQNNSLEPKIIPTQNEASAKTGKKKSKKKRKSIDEQLSHENEPKVLNITETIRHKEGGPVVEKKLKRKKKILDQQQLITETIETESLTAKEKEDVNWLNECITKKKKKSNTEKNVELTIAASNSEETPELEAVPIHTTTDDSSELDKPKKKKKSKKHNAEAEPVQNTSEIGNVQEAPTTVSENQINNNSSSCVYQINAFVAEKFRHTDIDGFMGSNLSEIVGYALSEDLNLEVVPSANDEERIVHLWHQAIKMNIQNQQQQARQQQQEEQQRLQSKNGQKETEEEKPKKRIYKAKKRKNMFRIV